MIQVLNRAFDIVELIAREPERLHPLGEIASALDINPGTCANILKTLVARRYVEQEVPRAGYTLGPMAHALAPRGSYRRRLVRAAEPLMKKLAADSRETVVLAAMSNLRRFVLCEVEGNRELQVRSDILRSGSSYEVPTGRVLLAHLSPGELDMFVQAEGLPGKGWPAARTRKALRDELSRIREAGVAVGGASSQVAAFAFPVREDGQVCAALGAFLPKLRFAGAHRRKVLRLTEEAARAIEKELSRTP